MSRPTGPLAKSVGDVLGKKSFFDGAIILAPSWRNRFFRGILYPLVKQSGYPGGILWDHLCCSRLIHFNVVTFIPLVVLAMVFVCC